MKRNIVGNSYKPYSRFLCKMQLSNQLIRTINDNETPETVRKSVADRGLHTKFRLSMLKNLFKVVLCSTDFELNIALGTIQSCAVYMEMYGDIAIAI